MVVHSSRPSRRNIRGLLQRQFWGEVPTDIIELWQFVFLSLWSGVGIDILLLIISQIVLVEELRQIYPTQVGVVNSSHIQVPVRMISYHCKLRMKVSR